MIGKANDLPRALPLIAPPRADELLSSWLTRIAQDYYIPPRGLLTHMGLSSPSVERLDLTLTFAQAITMSGFVRQPPDAIIGMTHAKLPPDCQTSCPSETSTTILPVMRVAAQTGRRGRRGSEKLDAGLARHLPSLRRRHHGCLERRRQGRDYGPWSIRRQS